MLTGGQIVDSVTAMEKRTRSIERDRRELRLRLEETVLRANDVITQLAAGTGDRETILRRWGTMSGLAIMMLERSRKRQERGA